ncbi:MAG: BMC domain-containing protein [Caldithrix sp.]|nr:BMC domain-containing protein [Caldithrix sp.]
MMDDALGFIETRGLTGAIEAADSMVKAARVHIVQRREIGSAFVTVIVRGELGACQAAVDAGSAAADRIGELVSAHVIPNPYADTDQLVDSYFIDKSKSAKKTPQNKPAKNGSKKKHAKATAPKQQIMGVEEVVMKQIKASKKGVTLQVLASELNKAPAEVRRVLKHLMDEQKVEKVGQRYFLLG